MRLASIKRAAYTRISCSVPADLAAPSGRDTCSRKWVDSDLAASQQGQRVTTVTAKGSNIERCPPGMGMFEIDVSNAPTIAIYQQVAQPMREPR
jgi:hypothetical protein